MTKKLKPAQKERNAFFGLCLSSIVHDEFDSVVSGLHQREGKMNIVLWVQSAIESDRMLPLSSG